MQLVCMVLIKQSMPFLFFIFAAHKEEMRNMPKSLDIP